MNAFRDAVKKKRALDEQYEAANDVYRAAGNAAGKAESDFRLARAALLAALGDGTV